MADSNNNFFSKDSDFGKMMKDLELPKPESNADKVQQYSQDLKVVKPIRGADPQTGAGKPTPITTSEINSIGAKLKGTITTNDEVRQVKASVQRDFVQIAKVFEKQNKVIAKLETTNTNNYKLLNKSMAKLEKNVAQLQKQIDSISKIAAASRTDVDRIKNEIGDDTPTGKPKRNNSIARKAGRYVGRTLQRGEFYQAGEELYRFGSRAYGAGKALWGAGGAAAGFLAANPALLAGGAALALGGIGLNEIRKGNIDRQERAGVKDDDTQEEIEKKLKADSRRRKEEYREKLREENRRATGVEPRDPRQQQQQSPGRVEQNQQQRQAIDHAPQMFQHQRQQQRQLMPGVTIDNGPAHRPLSFDAQYYRQKIDEQKAEFLKFGRLPGGFEFAPGYMGTLGSPGNVAAGGAMPLSGMGRIPGGRSPSFGGRAPSYSAPSAPYATPPTAPGGVAPSAPGVAPAPSVPGKVGVPVPAAPGLYPTFANPSSALPTNPAGMTPRLADKDFVMPGGRPESHPMQAAYASMSRVQIQAQIERDLAARNVNVPPERIKMVASALAGQAHVESKYNPTTVHDQGTGLGLYGHRLDRRSAALAYMNKEGLDPKSREAWNRFAAHELMNNPGFKGLRDKLLHDPDMNLEKATAMILDKYENPAAQHKAPGSSSYQGRQMAAQWAMKDPQITDEVRKAHYSSDASKESNDNKPNMYSYDSARPITGGVLKPENKLSLDDYNNLKTELGNIGGPDLPNNFTPATSFPPASKLGGPVAEGGKTAIVLPGLHTPKGGGMYDPKGLLDRPNATQYFKMTGHDNVHIVDLPANAGFGQGKAAYDKILETAKNTKGQITVSGFSGGAATLKSIWGQLPPDVQSRINVDLQGKFGNGVRQEHFPGSASFKDNADPRAGHMHGYRERVKALEAERARESGVTTAPGTPPSATPPAVAGKGFTDYAKNPGLFSMPRVGKGSRPAPEQRNEVYKQGTERLLHAGGGLAMNGKQLDPKLIHVMKQASKDLPDGYSVEMVSGADPRRTGTTNHPNGIAMDVKIYGPNGKEIPYDRAGPNMHMYEQLYQSMHVRGKELYPKEEWLWGGLWRGGGAPPTGDPMHYQRKVPGVGSQGMSGYDPLKGAPRNDMAARYLMTPEQIKAYRDSVKARMDAEKNPAATSPEVEKALTPPSALPKSMSAKDVPELTGVPRADGPPGWKAPNPVEGAKWWNPLNLIQKMYGADGPLGPPSKGPDNGFIPYILPSGMPYNVMKGGGKMFGEPVNLPGSKSGDYKYGIPGPDPRANGVVSYPVGPQDPLSDMQEANTVTRAAPPPPGPSTGPFNMPDPGSGVPSMVLPEPGTPGGPTVAPSPPPAPEAPAAPSETPAAAPGAAPGAAPDTPSAAPAGPGPGGEGPGGGDFPTNNPETQPESPGSSGAGAEARCFV